MSESSPSLSKPAQLRKLLESKELTFLMEAHSGLSARVAEEAGFKGLWASGLSISAQLGVRDNNEASWTQILEVVEFMNDAVSIPILLDGDTGYGNFNNVRRLVKKLCQRNIAGVCIEDKLFPKTNSFIRGERQPLAEVDEFCGRIKAGKDSQADPDFCLVARVEALIAGWGMDEALRRAEAYRKAGADAILVHSKKSQADEIMSFVLRWSHETPLIIVPTKYYSVPVEVYRRAGIRTVIWANHLLRASITAMQNAARQIHDTESVRGIEDAIAPLAEVFRLQGADELIDAEKRYLTEESGPAKAIVLAASKGKELAELTEDRPKCMLPIGGKPILHRLVENLRACGVMDITVVTGYKAEAVEADGIAKIVNSDFETTGELESLSRAIDRLGETTLLLYGDLIFRKYIADDLLSRREEIVIGVDSSAPESAQSGDDADRVLCSAPDAWRSLREGVTLKEVGLKSSQAAHGEWIGMIKISGAGRQWVEESLGRLRLSGDFKKLSVNDLLRDLLRNQKPIHVLYVRGHWVNINRLMDLDKVQSFLVGS